jgi:hypothetical protein
MYNPFSYFFSNPEIKVEPESEIKPQLEEPPKFKYSHVDAHLLLWDIHHLSYHELEDKYRAKHLTLCIALKSEGYPLYKSEIMNIESKLLTIPQELTFN